MNGKAQDALESVTLKRSENVQFSFGKSLERWSYRRKVRTSTLTELWTEESQVISFSHYPFKLTLRRQGEVVSEVEKYVGLDGEWLIRLVCDLLMEK